MAVLSVEVEANYEKMVRLREEIDRLEKALKSVGKNTPTAEIKKLESELEKAKNEFTSLASGAAESGKQIESFGASIAKMAGIIGGVNALKSLASQVVQVRGQFKDMEVSIETLVGKATADKIMPQIREMAKVSPLTMTDIIGAEQTMLSFNIDAEKSIEYLRALSDVSMGSSQKFNSLALAFSQMSSAGKLMGQDLMQMINAGFNPLQVMSEKTGKSISELKEEMSKGAISAEMVQQAFIDATSAGGKFYKMSENASKTINGQISMMEDAWDSMLNEIGMESEGLIMNGIQFVTSLIQNYEKVGKVLVGLIATYGAYRTAVMLATMQAEGLTIAEAALTKARTLAKKAQDLLNASMLTNPYVAVTAVIVGTVSALWALADNTSIAQKTQEEYDKTKEESIKKEQEHANAIQGLINKVNDETQALVDRQAAMLALQQQYPQIFEKYDIESLKLADILEIQKQINEEQAKQRRVAADKGLKAGMSSYHVGQVKEKHGTREEYYEEQYAKYYAARKVWIENRIPEISEGLKKLTDEELTQLLADYKAGVVAFMETKFVKNPKMPSAPTFEKKPTWEWATAYKQDETVTNAIETVLRSRQAQAQAAKEAPLYGPDWRAAKEAWETAKKELEKIKKDKDKYTTEQYHKAVAAEKAASDAFKKLGGDDKDTASAKKHNERIARQARERADKRKAELDAARAAKDLYFLEEQARINAMTEGAAKIRAQRKLDNEKELDQLERQKEDYIEKVVSREREAFNAIEEEKAKNNENYKMRAFDEDAARAGVDTGVYDRVIGYTVKKQKQQQDEVLKGLLDNYKSYEDKKQEIIISYLEDSDELQAEYEHTGDERYKRSLDERHKAYVQALNNLEREFGKGDYDLIFGDPARMTKERIEQALEAARAKLAQMDKEADPESFKALAEAIERLENARDSNPFEGWETSIMGLVQKLYQIRNIRKDIARYEADGNKEAKEAAEAQLEKAKKDLPKAMAGTGLATLGDTLASAASSMREVAEAAGDINLAEQAESLENASSLISSIASGAATGGWIGAIVGGATSLMGMLTKSITESVTVAANAKKAYEDYIDEVAEAGRRISDKDYDTIFGVNSLAKVIATTEAAKKAWKDYEDARNAGGTTYSYNGEKRWQTDLSSMLVLEGRTNVRKIVKEAQTLSERFPEIFDKDGNLVLKEAENVLKAYSQYSSEEWYENLDDAVNALNAYEDALVQVDEHLNSLFGSTASDLADTIYDAIDNGGNAWDMFEKKGADVIRSLGKQMLTETIQKQLANRWTEQLEQAAGDPDALAQTYDRIMHWLSMQMHTYTNAAQQWEEKYGDMFPDAESQQEASRKGYETLSEDTGDALLGRTTAHYESSLRLEGSVASIKESIDFMAANQVQIKDIAAESRAIIAASYLELQQIRENTGAIIKPIKNLSDKMDKWNDKIMTL